MYCIVFAIQLFQQTWKSQLRNLSKFCTKCNFPKSEAILAPLTGREYTEQLIVNVEWIEKQVKQNMFSDKITRQEFSKIQ